MIFGLDIKLFMRRTLPYFLRKPNTLALIVEAVGGVLEGLKSDLLIFRSATQQKLFVNAQIISLEKYLNDLYDPINRQIYIENTADIRFKYVRNKAELRPPVYIYNKSEGAAPYYLINKIEQNSVFDYIIHIPVAIVWNEDVLRSQSQYVQYSR